MTTPETDAWAAIHQEYCIAKSVERLQQVIEAGSENLNTIAMRIPTPGARKPIYVKEEPN